MRLGVIKNLAADKAGTPRIVFYLGLVVLLLLLLAISGKLNGPIQSKKIVDTKNESSQFQALGEVENNENSSEINDEESSASDTNTSTNLSISTKISVSVNSSNTNNETTGSAKVEVTQNGETQSFTEDFDEALGDCGFDISVFDGEFDFDCKFKQKSKNEHSIETDISEKKSSD